MDILEAISRRVSVRNYQHEPAATVGLEETKNRGRVPISLNRGDR